MGWREHSEGGGYDYAREAREAGLDWTPDCDAPTLDDVRDLPDGEEEEEGAE